MAAKILDVDRLAGTREWIDFDEFEDKVKITTEQECSPITDNAKMFFNEVDERANWKGNFHRVAQIPMSIYMQMVADGRIRDTQYLKNWLNDPENRFFRTRPGKV